MKNYAIYKIENWEYMKFDGRKKVFRGITREDFFNAKERFFKHQIFKPLGKYEEQKKCKSLETVDFLKRFVGTNYEKIIIEGNKHLYIASPRYKHADYNKSIFSENTPKNRKKAELINRLLSKA